jgi:hypothetical protein
MKENLLVMWQPDRKQWIVIWITAVAAFLVGPMGLWYRIEWLLSPDVMTKEGYVAIWSLPTTNEIVFAVIIVGVLVVWKLNGAPR